MINKKNAREKHIIIFEIRQSFPNLNLANHPVAINLMCPYHFTDKYHWQHETHSFDNLVSMIPQQLNLDPIIFCGLGYGKKIVQKANS